jgi:hypothetical protein
MYKHATNNEKINSRKLWIAIKVISSPKPPKALWQITLEKC